MPRLPNTRPRENTRGLTSTTASPAPMVLIATDGTPSSRAAVEKGLSIARELGARVTFVSAFRPPWEALGEPLYQRSLVKRLAVSRDALDEAKMAAQAFSIDADYEIVEGKPANQSLPWPKRATPISSWSARVISLLQPSAVVFRGASSVSVTLPCS